MEERLLEEDHAGQHAAQTPHVQTVVVHLRGGGTNEGRVWPARGFKSRGGATWGGRRAPYLIVHQQLRAFEIAGGHPDVVFLSGMVKFSQTPVDETQLLDRRRNDDTPTQVLITAASTQLKYPLDSSHRTPSNEPLGSHLSHLVVNHHVVRLDVAVHDAHAVTVVKSLRHRQTQSVIIKPCSSELCKKYGTFLK